MTYGEARALVTMLMGSQGEPAPDFSDDKKYNIGMHTVHMDPIKREMLFRLSINNRTNNISAKEYDDVTISAGTRYALDVYLRKVQKQLRIDTSFPSVYTAPVANQDDAPTEG